MRYILCVASVLCAASVGVAALLACGGRAEAQSAQELFNQVSDYRFFTVRRHNDIQGVESVFDDYRKFWLSPRSSKILVGADGRNRPADMPVCSDPGTYGYDPSLVKLCGSRHVVRAHSTVSAATDGQNGADIRGIGNLTYLGYEYLVSSDLFLGGGVSGAASTIDNKAGQGLKVGVNEFAAHVLGGYRIDDFLFAGNISLVRSAHNSTRAGNITGSFGANTMFLTVVGYQYVPLTRTAYVSLGLDYTLQIMHGSNFTESDGTLIQFRTDVKQQYQGDFTGSALFVQPLANAELFAKIGATFSVVNPPDRFVDVPVDVGGAIRLTDSVALTGSVGATFLLSDFTEWRGSLRLT